MREETKVCQNCKASFLIDAADFAFYEKIKVPAPTWCPECRLQRRLVFLNERSFFRRKCDLCKKDFISLYPVTTPHPVYCGPCFWDKWDPMDYGREYDFSRPFFEQFQELVDAMPRTGQQVITPTLINSEYCCIGSYLKNCYFLMNSDYCEDCAYSTALENSRNSFDMYMSDGCESCYEGVNLRKCFKTFFSLECENCVEVYFSKNLKGCTHCFGCVNLSNKEYYIFNRPFAKAAYYEEIKKFNPGSFAALSELRLKTETWRKKFPNRFMTGTHNFNVSGEYISHSKNVRQSYQILSSEECKFCHFLWMGNTKDAYDFTYWGGDATEIYECMEAGGGLSRAKFSFECWCPAHDIQYCMELAETNSNLFGCYALRNKHYCILNRQYAKEEYERMLPRVIDHMQQMPFVDSLGRAWSYGEFLPLDFSAFGYNETIAQEYFPFTKEQAQNQGYSWRDPEKRQYTITMTHDQIPDHIKHAPDSIIAETISCAHCATLGVAQCNHQCSTAFKIIPQELEFYRKMNLPLPRLCPNCRHYERLKQRNPLKLWHRKCQCAGAKSVSGIYTNQTPHSHQSNPCPNEFETSYAPDRQEIVYCEQCYQAEVV